MRRQPKQFVQGHKLKGRSRWLKWRPPRERAAYKAVFRFSRWNRLRKAERITKFMVDHHVETTAMIGVVSDDLLANEGIIERAVAARSSVVAVFDVKTGMTDWPFVLADGRALPCRDRSVGMVLANAIIEHVGDEEDQRLLVDEIARVGHCWVITTPNRWFPIESHTATAFRHWIPSWRRDRWNFSRLLSRREFKRLLPPRTRVVGHWWSATLEAYSSP